MLSNLSDWAEVAKILGTVLLTLGGTWRMLAWALDKHLSGRFATKDDIGTVLADIRSISERLDQHIDWHRDPPPQMPRRRAATSKVPARKVR